jgi:phenylpyruvate tautomerase PptA (4-oxalocrotonate tautomerase family)
VVTVPIVDVEIVLLPGESVCSGLAAEIADRCAEVFGSPSGGTWVKLHTMPREHYAENGGGPPHEVFPVFVSVLKARLPAPDALRAEVARLATAIAEATGRPAENIHIVYLPEGAGRVAFGGELVPAE